MSFVQSQDEKIKELSRRLERSESSFLEIRDGVMYRKRGDSLFFYIPQSMEKNVLFKYHDQMGHLGIDRTSETILRNWFPELKVKVKTHISNCLKCISYSPSSGKTEGTLHSIPKGNLPFNTLHIDHLGPIDKHCQIKNIF